IVEVLPEQPAVALVQRDGAGYVVGAAVVVGDDSVVEGGVSRHIRARLQRVGVTAEIDLALIESIAEGPRRSLIGVGNEELRDRRSIEDGAQAAGVLIGDGVEDEPLARMNREAELPVLPSHEMPATLEARSVGLADFERRRHRPLTIHRSLVEVVASGGGWNRNDRAIEHPHHPAGIEIDVGDDALDGAGVGIGRRTLVVGHDAHQPGARRRRACLRAYGPRVEGYVLEVQDPAPLHGRPPPAVRANDLGRQRVFLHEDGWLRARPWLPGEDVTMSEVNQPLDRPVRRSLVGHDRGLASLAHGGVDDQSLGRLLESDEGKPRARTDPASVGEYLYDSGDLFAAEWIERMAFLIVGPSSGAPAQAHHPHKDAKPAMRQRIDDAWSRRGCPWGRGHPASLPGGEGSVRGLASPALEVGVLHRDLVAPEGEDVAARDLHLLAVGGGGGEEPLREPTVARDEVPRVAEVDVGEPLEHARET